MALMIQFNENVKITKLNHSDSRNKYKATPILFE